MSDTRQLSGGQVLLSTRRSLLADPLSIPVLTWLRRIYVHPAKALTPVVAKTTMLKMTELIEAHINRDQSFGNALQSVVQFIAAPVPDKYVNAFDAVKRPRSSMLGTFISVVYGRALLLLVESRKDSNAVTAELEEFLKGAPTFIRSYEQKQAALQGDFIGHLIVTAEIEAQLDQHYFANALDHSKALFVEVHKPAGAAANPFAEETASTTVLNADPAAWYRLPASLAFAMTVWHQGA